MSPHTILVASSSSTTTTTASNQNTGNASASSTSASVTLSSSASLNAAIRSSNLPASLTITPTHGGGSSHHSNSMGANKAKLPLTQIAKSSITANTNRCSNLPTLQWPWSTTTTATSTIPPPSSSSSSTPSSLSFSTSTTGTNTHLTHTAANNTTSTTIVTHQAKKRIAPHVNGGGSDASSNAKKSRSNVNIQFQDGHHVANAAGAKRLKAAALEESQTKITGYFKSQMKAQMHAANNKIASSINSVASGNMLLTTTSSANSHSNTMTTNALTMSAPATTASLNKYFNILAQLKENSKAANNIGTTSNAAVTTGAPVTSFVSSNITQTAATTSTVPTIATNLTTPAVTITASKPQNLTVQPVTMPALKKIERPKPTKIAQVAPNLRKTPSSNNSYSNLQNGTGKSPAKKHVAIAPRTPEMKQQQQQNQLVSNKQENVKQSSSSAIIAQGAQTAASSAQQPAVLLTAIRLPSGQQQTTPTKQSIPNNKLTQASSIGSTNATNSMAGSPVSNTVSNSPATATTLYQLPAVQLPNLVQLPHLLAANGANLMQLNNMASLAKTAVSGATANTTAAASATSAQAAQAAAAQYFLNGTVFKLQQFTTATTTTSTTAATAGNGNPFNLLSASDLQDMLIKQQQQQQQLQQMQQQQKAAVANATATSFQEIFQQQIAAAIAANQQQQQQAQLQQLQRLGAAANIQQQPVFMATPAGLLLNAASLPAMLAQAAAALAVNTQQQQQQHQKALALPALQPIQQTPLPALSSIFAPQSHQQTNEQHDIQQQQQQQLAAHLALAQQQFITASQPPPLSSVTISANNAANVAHNSNNCANINSNVNISNSLNTQTSLAPAVATQNNTAKLAIVKANAAPTAFTTLSSQPPPLVTISNSKTRTHLSTTASGNAASQKPSVLSKPYQKRSPKVAHNQAKTSLNVPNPANKTNTGKITTSSGKIIASPTTPPPLVPTLTACGQQPVALTSVPASGIRAAAAASLTKTSSQLPTPALVSIAPTNTTPIAPKPVQSITCGSVTITPTSTAGTGKSLVNIAPKVSTAASNNQLYKFNSKTTTVNTLPTVSKTKAKSSTSDLFDLVKNSNGAISITPAPTAAVAAFNNTNNFSAPLNFSASTANFKPSMPLENFGKIKDEPMEDIPTVSTISNILAVPTTVATIIPVEDKNEIKPEPPTSFSGQIPTSSTDIKEELINPSTEEEEESEKASSPQPNILMNNECSSSSFSCHSNSVSSAADLSLEASTPASITSSSEAPSSACSMLSPLNTSCNQFVAPNPCSNSNSVGYSNSSNSCETAGGASSRDMLSEMVTSTCISSDSSEASISVSLPDNEERKQLMSDVKDIDENENGNENEKQRDLPTPESGIGGSLSNTESMDSSSKSSNSETSSSAASSTCEQEVPSPTSDTQTPPATPLAIDSSGSMEETQNESLTQSNSFSECTTSMASSDFLTPTIDTKLAELSSEVLPKCAISPILSQPKTIRFPAHKGHKRHDGICYWDKCNKKHDSNSKLLDHMQHQHVNSQTGPFSCLWVGCKVYNKESCSRRWLERHVLSHGGSKQFKCIVEGCGLRFGSQLALQKHVNNHFSATENKESTNKRTSDPPVPKQLRKNGKKLRYRRQPFSARMFDFFDAGIMEGLQHRLRQISTLTNGCNSITFQGQCIMKRKAIGGKTQCYVQWSPREIISDEWMPESEEPFLKTINIKQMKPSEKNKIESLLMTAYKLPYSPTIFENDYALSGQHHARAKNTNDKEDVTNSTTENSGDEEDDDDDNDDDDEDEDDTATTSAETISSYQNVLSITNTQMQQRRKHPRKQQCRITVTR